MKPLKYCAIFMLASGVFAYQTESLAQCSTGAWSAVTGTPLALGESTNPQGKKYEQSCGLTVDASNVPAFVTTDTPVNEPSVSVRFYLLADALDITSGDVSLLLARDDVTGQFELRLRGSGEVKFLVSRYRDNDIWVEHSELIPLQDVWQAIEASWTAGNGDGSFAVKVDDIEQFSINDLDNADGVINEIDFGVLNGASAAGELALDAFMLRRSGEPGLLAVNELRNISTRAEVLTSHEIVIGGFVISGDTDKCVVVRGRGLSVGVPDGEVRLADPTLVLKLGADTIASNDDWQDSPEADVLVDLGLAPPHASESAIYTCLPAGAYTALVRGVGETTGIGIVEVFDADLGTPYLENISTRAPVNTGAKQAIGGFIIDGDQPKQVLIRGRGPSVGAPDGVVRLADPRVRLIDSEGTTLIENDNWGDATNAADISASGLAPPNAAEAAILTTLDPGIYTAIVNGVGGTSGVGIVEVYDESGGTIAAQ